MKAIKQRKPFKFSRSFVPFATLKIAKPAIAALIPRFIRRAYGI